ALSLAPCRNFLNPLIAQIPRDHQYTGLAHIRSEQNFPDPPCPAPNITLVCLRGTSFIKCSVGF
ncbi:mCG1037739, partial [Mus musculus]